MSGPAKHSSGCARVRRRATPFLDGRLSAPERRQIQDHLRGCAACIGEYKALRRLSHAAAELPRAPAPRALARRVRRGLLRRRQTVLAALGRKPTRAVPAAVIAALLLAAVTLAAAVGWALGYRAGAAVPLRPRAPAYEPRAPQTAPAERAPPPWRQEQPVPEPATPASLERR